MEFDEGGVVEVGDRGPVGYPLRFQPSSEALRFKTLAVEEGGEFVRGGIVRNVGRGRRLGVTKRCPGRVSACLSTGSCEYWTNKIRKTPKQNGKQCLW